MSSAFPMSALWAGTVYILTPGNFILILILLTSPGLCLAADLYMNVRCPVFLNWAHPAFSDKDEQGVIHYPEIDLVRIAGFFRRVYTNSHMDVIARDHWANCTRTAPPTSRAWTSLIGVRHNAFHQQLHAHVEVMLPDSYTWSFLAASLGPTREKKRNVSNGVDRKSCPPLCLLRNPDAHNAATGFLVYGSIGR